MNEFIDKSLAFFILALACIWLVLDEIYGKKYISQFVSAIFPTVTNTGKSLLSTVSGVAPKEG